LTRDREAGPSIVDEIAFPEATEGLITEDVGVVIEVGEEIVHEVAAFFI